MPGLIASRLALQDLERLRQFLREKSPAASEKAAKAIREGLQRIKGNPEGHRPVADMPYHRELVIKFGALGYVARYRYAPGGDIVVLRIRHQRESGFPDLPRPGLESLALHGSGLSVFGANVNRAISELRDEWDDDSSTRPSIPVKKRDEVPMKVQACTWAATARQDV